MWTKRKYQWLRYLIHHGPILMHHLNNDTHHFLPRTPPPLTLQLQDPTISPSRPTTPPLSLLPPLKNFYFPHSSNSQTKHDSHKPRNQAMATTLFSTTSPSSISFQGGLKKLPAAFPKTNTISFRPSRKAGIVRAELNTSLVISLSTGLSLFLGRFVFFNFQRENVAKQGLPEQNGQTHFEAGDARAKEYVGLLKSNDPVGFNIVDVLAWGSIGHIVAYYILATSSNGYDPKFFD